MKVKLNMDEIGEAVHEYLRAKWYTPSHTTFNVDYRENSLTVEVDVETSKAGKK